MVVSVVQISPSPDADLVPKLLISFDIVNGRDSGCLEKQRRRLRDVGATDNVLLDVAIDTDRDIGMANSRGKVSGKEVFSLLNFNNLLAAIEHLKARRNPL